MDTTMRIPATKGKEGIIDASDFEVVSAVRWWTVEKKNGFYLQGIVGGPGKGKPGKPREEPLRGKQIYLHQFLTGAGPGFDVHHKNGDPLDNRRENLLVCTRSGNMRGRVSKMEGATSKYRGVCWDAKRKKWRATIRDTSGRQWHLGRFASEEAAARAFDRAARSLFGPEAHVNFPADSAVI